MVKDLLKQMFQEVHLVSSGLRMGILSRGQVRTGRPHLDRGGIKRLRQNAAHHGDRVRCPCLYVISSIEGRVWIGLRVC